MTDNLLVPMIASIFCGIMAISLHDFWPAAMCFLAVGAFGSIMIDDHERRQTLKKFGRRR